MIAAPGDVSSISECLAVPDVKVILNGALSAPEFAANEEFQKFSTYTRRPGSAAHVQNSADKARNDVASRIKDQRQAHKKLLDNMGKSDPPPQFKHLGGGMKKEDKDAQWELVEKKVAKEEQFLSEEFWAKIRWTPMAVGGIWRIIHRKPADLLNFSHGSNGSRCIPARRTADGAESDSYDGIQWII
ncbi:hypothetical protein DFH09DRAFT_1076808 [Mycena vulgaris]|nr:hypothetical protein DFH09DRAFT_1076808 [Mycena vulgaris]